ncbi:protein of unknown function [Kyrpidia spormannii]|uniref:Uncharacterized protein n=2 Tax=Kyrpidia spormannii TaxID=2055160 RepID=A0ACA8Z8E6_9BACL|nr:protein of unknown function [Kyrpidia spormannii]CAB3392883.1 protein of unknown function [Kyrpidia spormannii]
MATSNVHFDATGCLQRHMLHSLWMSTHVSAHNMPPNYRPLSPSIYLLAWGYAALSIRVPVPESLE